MCLIITNVCRLDMEEMILMDDSLPYICCKNHNNSVRIMKGLEA